MPGLLRGLARTAAVAGTATAVSGRVRRRQDAKFAQRDAQTDVARDEAYTEQVAPQQQYAPPPQQYAAPPAAPPADPTADRLEQLKTLGELKQSGVLTDAEFEAQKAKILAG
jgi:Short C-terminal domain/Domain of unknwon function (DUF3824)